MKTFPSYTELKTALKAAIIETKQELDALETLLNGFFTLSQMNEAKERFNAAHKAQDSLEYALAHMELSVSL